MLAGGRRKLPAAGGNIATDEHHLGMEKAGVGVGSSYRGGCGGSAALPGPLKTA